MGAVLDARPDLSAAYPLGEAEVAAYQRDGHVVIRGLASPAELQAYRPAIVRVVDAVASRGDRQGRIDDYASLFTQVTNAWRLDETVRQFVYAQRFARVAAELMDVDGVRLYHDQALIKEPGGKPTPWHQDRFYWPLDTEHTVTLWLALVDVPQEMGPMTFASGSQRHAPPGQLPISEEVDRRLADFIAERGFPLSRSALAAGDATFHSGRTLHSAGPNRGARRREVMTIIYYADGARVLAPDNPFRETDRQVFLPGVEPGQPAASPLNPVLYSRLSAGA